MLSYAILNEYVGPHRAEELAKIYGLSSKDDAAEMWFNRNYLECTFRMGKLPEHNQFIKKIDCGDLYYDCDANYYFLVDPCVLYAPYIMI